jgi:hypothetical protein
MKSDVMQSIVQIEAELLNGLVTEVKETLATDIKKTNKPERSFGIVDLWNIRRNARSAASYFRK